MPGSIVSAPLVTEIVPVLPTSALSMALAPVDSSVPAMVSVPPARLAPFNVRVLLASTLTVP